MQSTVTIKKQKGFTALQIVIGLAAIGFILTCVLKILPVYMDDMTVKSTLKQLGESSEFTEMSKDQIVSRLQNQFDLNGVRGAATKSIKIYRRTDGWLINIDYEERIPFWGNLDVVITFQNQLNAAKPEDCCKKIIPDVAED